MIVNQDFSKNASLGRLIEAVGRNDADIIQSVWIVNGKPVSAILAISGPNTKAYLQAIATIDRLLAEDREE